ncbi:MAG: circularly permuted type 2 ATP-grasp protein [Verrucomicrobiota bacterium]
MPGAPFSSHEHPLRAAQAQAQSFGLDNVATATTLALQKSLAAYGPEKLGRMFALAEELREEEGAYLSPREIAPVHAAPEGGFDLMPLIIAGEEMGPRRARPGPARCARGIFSCATSTATRKSSRPASCRTRSSTPTRTFTAAARASPASPRPTCSLPPSTCSKTHAASGSSSRSTSASPTAPATRSRSASSCARSPRGSSTAWKSCPSRTSPRSVLDVLQELVRLPDGDVPRGVLLAQGSSDAYYLDDAALARQMGVPIVQGNDLVVLDSRLYLKTIGGIEPVDVILRRMATSLLDPRHLRPGQPLRRARPALLRAQGLPRRRQRPRLRPGQQSRARRPPLPHHRVLPRRKAAAALAPRLRDARRRRAPSRSPTTATTTSSATPGSARPSTSGSCATCPPRTGPASGARSRATPASTSRTSSPPRPAHPCWTPTGVRSLPVTLRAYALGLDRVSPCALAWTGAAASLAGSQRATDRVKDVWILRASPPPPSPSTPRPRRTRSACA